MIKESTLCTLINYSRREDFVKLHKFPRKEVAGDATGEAIVFTNSCFQSRDSFNSVTNTNTLLTTRIGGSKPLKVISSVATRSRRKIPVMMSNEIRSIRGKLKCHSLSVCLSCILWKICHLSRKKFSIIFVNDIKLQIILLYIVV